MAPPPIKPRYIVWPGRDALMRKIGRIQLRREKEEKAHKKY